MRTYLAGCGLAALLVTAWAAPASAADEKFDITRFEVNGAKLLSASEIDHALQPLTGPGRSFGDVQLAVNALEAAYRQAGYTAVQVSVPEQELTGKVVRIDVRESIITSVTVSGNTHFSDANIRASLSRLQPGEAPRLGAISESVQLANENPAKQVSVTLGEGALPGTIDAAVAVIDNKPLSLITTLDNTGSSTTGHWRAGAALRHANLFDRDHVGTLAYTTSPDAPSGADVGLFSAGYRVPLYSTGDSLDFIYGKSRVSSPGATPVLGGLLGFTGRGDVYGLRWNHFLGRQGESTARLVVGIDHRQVDSRCEVGGQPVSIAGPTPPIAACVPYETTPVSLTYSSQREGVNQLSALSLSLSRNIASGSRFTNVDGRVDRYSYLTPGNRSTRDGFMALRGGASFLQGFASDWQARLVGNAQYTNTPLVGSEQFSLTGASQVRGFQERAVAADSGLVFNAEVYTPELAGSIGLPGQLRVLFFYDAAYGRNGDADGTVVPRSVSVASMGVGARYSANRDFSLRLDVARVNKTAAFVDERRGDWHAHLSAMLAF